MLLICWLIDMDFPTTDLKYHDTTVRISSSREGKNSFTEPDAKCWNTVLDMVKKKLAQAHSFTKGNLGNNWAS